MARETKQDRIIRGIYDQTTEHLHELKTIDANPNAKESDVERWAASFLKNCLGFMSSSGYSIRSQEAKGKMRPDLIVLKDEKPIFVVEVKKTSFDLHKSDFRSGKVQLNEYLNTLGNVKWGILTNGLEWKLYDFSNPQAGGIEKYSFDLKSAEGDTFSFEKKFVEELCYEMFYFHECCLTDKTWEELSKEATAFSPESLAKAILSSDVVKYIGKYVRGEHDYKANIEVLTDRVYSLLEKGLNDAVGGWNETKAAEIQKYVKNQKRASRKVRKTPKKEDSLASVVVQVTTAADVPQPIVVSVDNSLTAEEKKVG
ncbi:type I restriction enzyme HsdR N-terminal domain-containing protein [bacterium]|nr:type I restriction enzyme HsdR N-terminal domain-containing protein [bacterium]